MATLEKEVDIHRKLLHENILRVLDYASDENKVCIVCEYATKGTLFKYIKEKKCLTENEAFSIFTQVCGALHFLHKRGIVHRDLKPENFLIFESGLVKISNFVCSVQFKEDACEWYLIYYI